MDMEDSYNENTQSTSFSSDSYQEYSNSSYEGKDSTDAMNDAIIRLQKELVTLYSTGEEPEINEYEYERKRRWILSKIEDIYEDILNSVLNGQPPKFVIRNNRNWENCMYDSRLSMKPIGDASNFEVNFTNAGSRNKFAMIIFALGKIYKLISTRSFCTKRELFYQNIESITVQSQLDHVLTDITNLFDVSLYELNIYASSKGLVYGPLEIVMENSILKCNNSGGTTVPYNIYDIKELKCDAHLILLIEKDAVFQKLICENITKTLGPCLLITGKGFPDINTRYLLKLLWDKLAIPIFALVDPDPWGIEIMCTYRFGSLALSHQSQHLAVPSIRWLGIHPSEIKKFYDNYETLSQKDRDKLEDLLDRPYIKAEPMLRRQIQVLLDENYKAEIEGISSIPSHLIKVYIPKKITHNGVL